MGIFDKLLDAFVLDDSKNKPRRSSNIQIRKKNIGYRVKTSKDAEKETSISTGSQKGSPSKPILDLYTPWKSELESTESKFTPIDATVTDHSNTVMDIHITEAIDKLKKERGELLNQFEDNPQRIRDMGNTLICDAEDDTHEPLIWNILECYSPYYLKLIMIDETGVVYNGFNGFAHLLIPVVNDIQKSVTAMNWLYYELQDRFKKFANFRAKNIDIYNEKQMHNCEEINKPMPYILVVVHEASLFSMEDRDAFNSMLLNGPKAGIFFLLFSRYSSKNLPFGKEMDLLSIKNIPEAKRYFQFGHPIQNKSLKYSDNMSGIEFEHYCCELLQKNGYDNVEVTKASADYGCDLIAAKDQIKYAIQCKKYSSPVGITAIQEVIASKSIYKCHVAAVLTNNTFTTSATKLARENNVLLWDGNYLNKLNETAFPSQISEDSMETTISTI